MPTVVQQAAAQLGQAKTFTSNPIDTTVVGDK
jgi:hypothetical protein